MARLNVAYRFPTRFARRSMHKSTALFAVLCVAAGLVVGLLWYVVIWAIAGEDMHPLDLSFYLRLYSTIGSLSGLLAWYVASLVARKRVRARSVACIIAIPLMFILVLAIDLNPLTAIVVILLFSLGSLPTYIAVQRKKTEVA